MLYLNIKLLPFSQMSEETKANAGLCAHSWIICQKKPTVSLRFKNELHLRRVTDWRIFKIFVLYFCPAECSCFYSRVIKHSSRHKGVNFYSQKKIGGVRKNVM